jgi:hypothetical protein
MQHNALHGAEKKDYCKTQDISTGHSSPPQATGHSATILESSHLPSETTEQPNLDSSEPIDQEDEIPSVNESDEIVETEYFDIPFAPAHVNVATTINNYKDIDSDSIITDHLQYITYDS